MYFIYLPLVLQTFAEEVEARDKEIASLKKEVKRKEKKIRDLVAELKEALDMLNKAKWEAETSGGEDGVKEMAEEENEVKYPAMPQSPVPCHLDYPVCTNCCHAWTHCRLCTSPVLVHPPPSQVAPASNASQGCSFPNMPTSDLTSYAHSHSADIPQHLGYGPDIIATSFDSQNCDMAAVHQRMRQKLLLNTYNTDDL